MRNLFFLILFLSRTGFAQESIVRLWQKGNKAAKVSGEQAFTLYLKAYEQAKKENNLLWQANICVDLSGSLYEQGNFQKAADRCIEGLKLINDNKFISDSTEFKLQSALAACFKSLNDLQSAFHHYELANQIFHNHPELENQILLYVTFHYSNQGGIWYSLGDMNRALIYYEKGLLLAEKLPDKSDYALILDNISSIYLYKQDFSKAIDLFERAISSYKTQNKSIYNTPLSEMYFSLANCYFKVGEYSKTLQLTRIARKIATGNLPAEEAVRLISSSIILEANVYIKEGHKEKAKKIFNQIIEKENNYSSYLYNGHFEAYLGLSEIETLNGNYQAVLRYTQKALSEISGVKNIKEFENPSGNHSLYVFIGMSRVLFMKIEALNKLYEQKKHLKFLHAAFETQKLSVDIAKKIRQSHETIESKALFSHLFYSKYETLIELSFLLYEKTQAEKYLIYCFYIIEESKSIILADNLALQNSYRNSGSDSLINKLKANQAYLAYLKSSSEKKIDAIKTYELKVNQILEKINIVNKSFAESFRSDSPINLKLFQKNLDPKSVYLNYILIKNQIYVTLVRKNKVIVKRISIVSNELLYHKNLLKTALITNPGPYSGFKARKSAAYFYNILIKPFEADLNGIDNVIINPDNEMIELSFDILVPHEKSNDYLIKKYNISYLNSALNYNDKIKNKFSRADQNWLSFAPFGSKTKNSSDINIQNLTILPSTIKEINGIKGQSIINEKSTKQTFVKTISELKDRVILIATHASENNGEPYLNFFPANDNYKLYANEIQYLDFKTPLVILGACESNAGKKMKGSGVLSIAKAFSIGGCPSVVGSLWEVHDESMAVLVSLFYKHLMRGERKDVALRLAKLEYLETETGLRNDPPYYWAHLQIIGDVSPLIIWPVILRYVTYGLMVVILSGSIVYGIRSRKRFFN